MGRLNLENLSKEDLIEKYLDLERKYKDLERKYKDKKKNFRSEFERLNNELKKYKNAHTPSSANSHLQKNTQKSSSDNDVAPNKVGRKKGKKSRHVGKTRAPAIPDHIINVTTKLNPSTGNKNIKPTGYIKERTITDFEIKTIVTKYNIYEYRDLDTNEIFFATHPDIPKRGIFGRNALAFANHLRYECNVVFSKIANTFTKVLNIPITTSTAISLSDRAAENLSPHYQNLKSEVKNEEAVYGDETSAKNNGAPGWLWGFFSISLALFVFNKQRGGDIVEKILGKDFTGILGCDGWSTYKVFSEEFGVLLQRCWAHAIREVKQICIIEGKKKNLKLEKGYEWFCDIFNRVKEARKIKDHKIREQKYEFLVNELDRWIQVHWSYRKLKPVVKKIKNGKEHWFTCVLHPEIEPTNNRAERGLRSWVVLRKIIGCLRTKKGENTTEIMMSLFQTWKLRGLNPYEELKALL